LADFEDVEGVGRDIRVVRTGFKLSGQAPRVDRPPPRLGAHNREIYGELGLGAAELQRLEREGVL
jgi:formyl-CoA transferase